MPKRRLPSWAIICSVGRPLETRLQIFFSEIHLPFFRSVAIRGGDSDQKTLHILYKPSEQFELPGSDFVHGDLV